MCLVCFLANEIHFRKVKKDPETAKFEYVETVDRGIHIRV